MVHQSKLSTPEISPASPKHISYLACAAFLTIRNPSSSRASRFPGFLVMLANLTHAASATAVYEEQDGDFVFTRASKRVKTSQLEPEPEVELAQPPKHAKKPYGTRTRRSAAASNKVSPPPPQSWQQDITVPKRQSRRLSALPSAEVDRAAKRPATRRAARTPKTITEEKTTHVAQAKPAPSYQRGRRRKEAPPESPPRKQSAHTAILDATEDEPEDDDDAVDAFQANVAANTPLGPEGSRHGGSGQKIAIPFSDTPVINRNKEMRRKGGTSGRRSSLGMRGRRASSLISNGQSALPHREVDPSEFYKHISDGLLEYQRMKQLLTWCGERALSEKPPLGSENSNAILGGEFENACGNRRLENLGKSCRNANSVPPIFITSFQGAAAFANTWLCSTSDTG